MNKYPALNLPNNQIRLRDDGYIFDLVRKKWLVLTPEEWVRQHVVNFLNSDLGYPIGLMQLEKGIRVNGLLKRTDLQVADNSGNPLLLVECKEPRVSISQQVFDQIARYNMTLKVPFLLVSNGLKHYCCHINIPQNKYTFLKSIPTFVELLNFKK